MLKRAFLILIVLGLAQAACTLTFFAEPTATATEIVLPTNTATMAATDTATVTPTASQTLEPTETLEPSETPEDTDEPTVPPFDPASEYGAPSLFDGMDTDKNWAGTNGLPDDENIRLALGSSSLHVTGKQVDWDTWWFTSTVADDFFLQIKVNSGDCSGKQAYGLIMRGPSSAGIGARGYIYTFSCDGYYRLDRLDTTAPFTKVELIGWTQSDFINDGENENNVMSVRMIGTEITLFANGLKLETIEDGKFATGRFGLFVNAGSPGNYTFDVDELSYWNQ
jgi:hypothetical protein